MVIPSKSIHTADNWSVSDIDSASTVALFSKSQTFFQTLVLNYIYSIVHWCPLATERSCGTILRVVHLRIPEAGWQAITIRQACRRVPLWNSPRLPCRMQWTYICPRSSGDVAHFIFL